MDISHANGEVRFNDGNIKHFEYNGTSDICIPKLYDNFEEMKDNWRKYKEENCRCKHAEEPVDIYTNYGGGFSWKGKACRKCMMITKGNNPFDEDIIKNDGIPKWAEKNI